MPRREKDPTDTGEDFSIILFEYFVKCIPYGRPNSCYANRTVNV